MLVRRLFDSGEHDVRTIPMRGTFGDRVWKKNDGDGVAISSGVPHDNSGSNSSSSSSSNNNNNGMYDDMKLTHTDPLYMNILSSFRGIRDAAACHFQ